MAKTHIEWYRVFRTVGKECIVSTAIQKLLASKLANIDLGYI